MKREIKKKYLYYVIMEILLAIAACFGCCFGLKLINMYDVVIDNEYLAQKHRDASN